MDQSSQSNQQNQSNQTSQTYVIGVCGGSCSGKTTVCEKILEQIVNVLGNMDNLMCIESQDNYYKTGNDDTNYDIPSAVDFDLLADHIEQLIAGNKIKSPLYDYATHSRKQETREIGPAKIIIVEGILIFCNERIRNLCNLRVFVEAEEILCYNRRLERDVRERGRSFEEVGKRYLEHVAPSFRNYINPSRYYANISLINNTHDEFIGLEILFDHIEKKIRQLV